MFFKFDRVVKRAAFVLLLAVAGYAHAADYIVNCVPTQYATQQNPMPLSATSKTGSVSFNCSTSKAAEDFFSKNGAYQLGFSITDENGNVVNDISVSQPSKAHCERPGGHGTWQNVSGFDYCSNNPYPITVTATSFKSGLYKITPVKFYAGPAPLDSTPTGSPVWVQVSGAIQPHIVIKNPLSCPSVNVKEKSTCSITYENTGSNASDPFNLKASVNSASDGFVGEVSGCSAALKPNATCTATFTYTAPSTPGTYTVYLKDQSNQAPNTSAQVLVGQPSNMPPDWLAKVRNCSKSSTGQCACSVVFSQNPSNASALFNATPGFNGSAPPSISNVNICGPSLGSGACHINKVPVSKNGSVSVSFSYLKDYDSDQCVPQTDGQVKCSGSIQPKPYQFTQQVSPQVTPTESADITATIHTPSPDQNYVKPDSELTIPFYFENISQNTYYFSPEISVSWPSGKGSVFLPACSSTVTTNCYDSPPSNQFAGYTSAQVINVHINPDRNGNLSVNGSQYNVGVGTQLTVTAQVDFGDKSLCSGYPYYSKTSYQLTIGTAPIFAKVVTNRPFIKGSTDEFYGAFVFQNNSTDSVTADNVSALGNWQSQGLIFDESCKGLTNEFKTLSNFQLCSSRPTLSKFSDSLINSTCIACFYATDPGNVSGTDIPVSAKLSYTGSAKIATKDLVVNPTYRHIQLKNMCKGTVWPTFVSGAAYYYCNHNNDCPAGTQCYKAGHQCMVPATTSTIDPKTNQCNGKGGYPYPGSSNCSQGCNDSSVGNNVCPTGSTCKKSNGLCYWNLPSAPSSSGYSGSLGNGDEAILMIPNLPFTSAKDWSAVWSGGVVARTGCDSNGTNCATAACTLSGDKINCAQGTAPTPPLTQAEFTMLYKNHDYYDVEVINGFNIPVSMKPVTCNGDSCSETYSGTPVAESPYTCNKSGEPISGNTCPWTFAMQSYDTDSGQPTDYTAGIKALHTFVTSGGDICVPGSKNTKDQCDSPAVCGIASADALKATSGPKFTCGKVIGFWSTNQICATNTDLNYTDSSGGTLNCTETINGNGSLSDWLGCAGNSQAGASCYGNSAGSGDSCCGCPYWSAGQLGGSTVKNIPPVLQALFGKNNTLNFKVLPYNGDNDYCKASTSDWNNKIQLPSLVWMKQGCSSVYTFAYDDPTSTFTCSSASVKDNKLQNPAGVINTQDYRVTFCPTGTTGKVNGNSVQITNISGDSSVQSTPKSGAPTATLSVSRKPTHYVKHINKDFGWIRIVHKIEGWVHQL